MKAPKSYKALEALGRVRLSDSFFFRDFLHSDIAQYYGLKNVPEDPDLAIQAGKRLCKALLEPLQEALGPLSILSGYQSPEVNRIARRRKLDISEGASKAGHIWDQRDDEGRMGATACIFSPRFAEFLTEDEPYPGGDGRALAWWVHDRLPYSSLQFFPEPGAFSIQWRQQPERRIESFAPEECLTKPGKRNHKGDHSSWYRDSWLFDRRAMYSEEEWMEIGESIGRDMERVRQILTKSAHPTRKERDFLLSTFCRCAEDPDFGVGSVSDELASYIATEFQHIMHDDGYTPFPAAPGRPGAVDWERVYRVVDISVYILADKDPTKRIAIKPLIQQALEWEYPDVHYNISEKTLAYHVTLYNKRKRQNTPK